ncbi:MAG: hypothetical protein NTX25_17010, partial [Proteobacteria bacterium]|nr:hypothetical protein [Pseudomonadota bacterium]
MHTLHKWFLTFLLIPSLCQALPLGFGRNQGDLKYAELLSPNFYVYHDARAPHEARVILEALEAARPKLENWIGVRRKDPLKVILSSTSANASFANFITDAIELQTLARGGRDLAWHEYVHSTMYRHLDGIFGPAGSIIHLPWMPAWWIEGLAETLSVSNGSDIQNGIERQFALNGDWPSYDKLHALYDDGRFSTIGYAISGAFVSYILRTGDANRLPEMLETFYKYSMPWYWPWSFVPFAKFMPMDEALTAFTGKRGIELYEDYKAAASQYWQAQKDLTFIKYSGKGLDLSIPQSQSAEPKSNGLPGESIGFSSSYSLQTRGDNVYFLRRSGDELFEAQAKFENGVAENFEKTWILPSDALIPRIHRQQESIYLTQETDQDISVKQSVWLLKDNKKTKLFDRLAGISELFLSADKLIWLEEFLEHDQICWVPRARLAEAKRIKQVDIHCPISAEYPKTLNIIGSRSLVAADGQDESSEIWLNRTEETIMGDRYQLQRWTLADDKLHNVPMNFGGKPLSVAFNGQDTWLALADRKQHFLRRLDPKAQCLEEHELANIITRLHNSLDNQLILSLWQSNSNILVKTDAQKMPSHPCRLHDEPSSPLLRAMLDGDKPLKSIIADSSPWQNRTETTTRNDQQKITQASILGLQKGSASKSELNSQPYVWRGRPVFAFPWIGYDPQGLSYGIISVPLMDHLQNETAQLTALYGAASHYPDIQLGLTSNRFNTSFGLDLYRKQTWNGV